jgi:hypothetical protein
MRLRAEAMAPYTVTSDDALWLARAVEAEGPVQAQVAATLISGFAFARSRGFTKPLATFVRAYAQPVNPRWYHDGDLYLASIAAMSDSQKAAALKDAQRRESVHSMRIAFTPGTQSAVMAALNGRVILPRGTTDYAAANIDATHKQYVALTPVAKGVNRLWSRPGAADWAGYLIDATDAWPWLVALLVLGFVAYRGIVA